MKRKFIFATNNLHKLEEVQQMLNNQFTLVSLKDMGCVEDIPENEPTIEGNALFKARYIYQKYGKDCFADDSGLEVEVLNNAAGVRFTWYAGESKDSQENMNLLLENLKGKKNRKARFRTVIACVIDGQEFVFEGIINGEIKEQGFGKNGFGYDPIFCPEGYAQTFAELPSEVKNQISHRALAVQKFLLFLKGI